MTAHQLFQTQAPSQRQYPDGTSPVVHGRRCRPHGTPRGGDCLSVVLVADETFLLGEPDQLAIDDQGGGRAVVVPASQLAGGGGRTATPPCVLGTLGTDL